MSLVKILRTLKNNWKKSTFGALALAYGCNMAMDKYETEMFMRAACEEALKYGEERIEPEINPRVITVILNPAANRRKAKNDYEKYCEPLLNLAGIMVNVVSTTSEGGAKDVVNELPNDTSALVVAGGDGTLSECITGLLRMGANLNKCPIGILPLGRTNTVGNRLFPHQNKRVKQLASATMAVIKGETIHKDVMKIEAIETEKELPGKPIYALSSIEWGAHRDAISKRDKYWFYGSLRDYATYLFNGYKNTLTWNCSGTVKYSVPCGGCKNCTEITAKNLSNKGGWSFRGMFMSKSISETTKNIDYSRIQNDECNIIHERCFKTTEFKLNMSDLVNKHADIPHLISNFGPPRATYIDFVKDGWNRINGNKPTFNDTITVRRVEILPKELPKEEEKVYYSIDNDDFDIKPICVTIIPKAVLMYCSKDNENSIK